MKLRVWHKPLMTTKERMKIPRQGELDDALDHLRDGKPRRYRGGHRRSTCQCHKCCAYRRKQYLKKQPTLGKRPLNAKPYLDWRKK